MALETPINHFIMALEISKIPNLWRWGYEKMPIYGVGDTLKPPYYGVRNLKNPRFMALGIQKNADLWR